MLPRLIIISDLPSIIVATAIFTLILMPVRAAISVSILVPICILILMIMSIVLRLIVKKNSSMSNLVPRIFDFFFLGGVHLHHL
jgi:hypothetical protein